MNVPALELKDFLEEYGALTFPDSKLLRVDLFCRQEKTNCHPVFALGQQEQALLCDAAGTVLCRSDRITPLFLPAQERRVALDVQDLLEQLSGLRIRVPRKDYEAAQQSIDRLARPAQPFAPAYLVEQEGLLGVVDPLGQIIVPAEYARIETFAFSDPGDAGLFLCHRGGHRLNSTDVYDLSGRCIFSQISSLRPREETVLTPADGGPSVKKIKSLWVIRQSIDRPFPEDPDFQLVLDEAKRYTLKELHCSGTDWCHCPLEEGAALSVGTDLLPLATVIAQSLDCSADDVLGRLSDYRAFRRERTPPALQLTNVRPDTPLDKLSLNIRIYHCLVGSGLRTAADVAGLSEAALLKLRHATPEIRQQISLLKEQLATLIC